uniref:non-specific serine/threonine protein kinase n=1 Tax=Paramormyrops kingsleyae TaxID=1676925 RepID=A0A3B3SHI9_9TELE
PPVGLADRAGRTHCQPQILNKIGCGIFSCVKLGVHSLTKDKVAIKILDKTRLDPQKQQLLWREVASMERLWLPNIARLYEVEETPSHLHLVMEHMVSGL